MGDAWGVALHKSEYSPAQVSESEALYRRQNLQKYPDESQFEDVPLVEFMYFVFTRMHGESYCRRLRYLLLCLCGIFEMLINSLVCR